MPESATLQLGIQFNKLSSQANNSHYFPSFLLIVDKLRTRLLCSSVLPKQQGHMAADTQTVIFSGTIGQQGLSPKVKTISEPWVLNYAYHFGFCPAWPISTKKLRANRAIDYLQVKWSGSINTQQRYQ